jgi:predicted enzyme related to lactoylglutathione lyase
VERSSFGLTIALRYSSVALRQNITREESDAVDFASIRMISDDLDPIVRFYEQVTGVPAVWPAPVFAEVRMPSCTIAFGHTETAQLFNNSARPADNHTVIIEFLVEDVDEEFERLRTLVGEWVQEPTTMPWGNRSILFRDPDGNLVNLFTPVTEEPVKRFSKPTAGSQAAVAR